MSNQGTIRLKVTNGAPAIEKLWNGRFKLEFFCDNNSPREDWYYENVAALLPDYGILQTTNFGSGVSEDWEAIPDSVYPNMRLVLAEYPYNVRAGKHYVKLTYETLTAAWVAEKAEDIDYELNGLKSISRTFVALPDTAYTNVIGTSTITSGGTTLYLGGFNIEETDAKWELTEVWFEAGTLNVQRVSESDGVYRVTTTFLGVEGTVVGPIIAKTEGDFEGLKTITVVSMQDASGASLITDTQPVASHSILNEFSYPGIVTISTVTLSGQNGTYTFYAKDFSLKPPTVSRVPATIKVSFKTTGAISYTGTSGLWNPTTWAEGSSKGIGWNYIPFSIARGFRGYRIDPNATNSYSGFGIPGTANVFDMISGKRIFGDTSYSIQVSGGPPDPSGSQYTLDYSVSLAFEDTSGVPYYKHTEIVATIPSR
jgi:hypothetical protein